MEITLSIMFNQEDLLDILQSLPGMHMQAAYGSLTGYRDFFGFEMHISFIAKAGYDNLYEYAVELVNSLKHLHHKILIEMFVSRDSEFTGKHAVLAELLHGRMDLLDKLTTDDCRLLQESIESKML